MLWYEDGDISRILAIPRRGMISGRQPATESLDAEADNSDASRYREKSGPLRKEGVRSLLRGAPNGAFRASLYFDSQRRFDW